MNFGKLSQQLGIFYDMAGNTVQLVKESVMDVFKFNLF